MGRLICLLLLLLVAGACDRFGYEADDEQGEIIPGESPGTFTATAGVINQGGFERMEGPAHMEIAEEAGVVIRLVSTFAFDDTTTVVFQPGRTIPGEGLYAIADLGGAPPPSGIPGFYRSVLTSGRQARSESGELVVTSSGPNHVRGSFDMIVFIEEATGPTTSVRRRFAVQGAFYAERR